MYYDDSPYTTYMIPILYYIYMCVYPYMYNIYICMYICTHICIIYIYTQAKLVDVSGIARHIPVIFWGWNSSHQTCSTGMQVGHSEIFGESSEFTQTGLWFWVYKCFVGICQLDIPKRCLTLDTFVLLYMHFLFLRPWRLQIVWSFNACKQCKRNKQPTGHAGRKFVISQNSGLLPDGGSILLSFG
jgi:hypothetical protein